MEIYICNYNPKFGEAIEELQRRYIGANPQGSKFVPKVWYERDAKNVFCAVSGDESLCGYGVLIPAPVTADNPIDVPHTLWIYIRVDPDSKIRDGIQESLFESILNKAYTYAKYWQDRKTRLSISYPSVRSQEIDYFKSKGFKEFECLVQMSRDLSQPIVTVPLPESIRARRVKPTEDNQAYIRAYNIAFPTSPITEDKFLTIIASWQKGTSITAFDEQERIIGSVMAYTFGGNFGLTEEVFVLPEWRGRGIAKYLVTQGLIYLRELGIQWAGLEVRESNLPAINLYQGLGYQRFIQEIQAGRFISQKVR